MAIAKSKCMRMTGVLVLAIVSIPPAFTTSGIPPKGVFYGPSGWVGRWSAPITGLPNSKLASAPVLGNGYAGVVLGGGADGVDFWVNTNAIWNCVPSGKELPPALCARTAFGGMLLRPADAATTTFGSFIAEQRLMPAHLFTQQTLQHQGGTESTLMTVTYMHPEDNVIVTNVTWDSTSAVMTPSSIALNISLWVYGNTTSSGSGDGTTLIATQKLGDNTSIKTVWTAMATRFQGDVQVVGQPVQQPGPQPHTMEIVAQITLNTNSSCSIMTAITDNIMHTGQYDPTNSAQALVQSTTAAAVDEVAMTWWKMFWEKSSISLPSSPTIESFWYGAQYISATMSASGIVEENNGGLVPPSGLYGPWVTSINPSWHGDYTLDYNQEAQYYGFYNSNHEEHAEAYFASIEDWMGAAKLNAQQHAQKSNITCPNNALHFSCHLAPWGYQSLDTSTYMHWNGNFAALLFINKWEYTRNKTWAKAHAYPLLDGINAWWSCYLVKDIVTGVYHDFRSTDPDNEHENQAVADPQIGLALILRCLTAQLEMAAALEITPPDYLQDLISHFPIWNTGIPSDKPHPPPPRPSPPVDCTKTGTFTAQPGVRCVGDHGETHVKTVQCCQAWCEADASCDTYSFCNDNKCNAGGGQGSCWKYPKDSKCSSNQYFTSGTKVVSSGGAFKPVWTSFANASVQASDAFALYPLWPSELIGRDEQSQATIDIARSSFAQYYGHGIGTRPVLVYPAAVRAGTCDDTATINTTNSTCQTSDAIVLEIEAWLHSQQLPSFMPEAPGGGTENIGVSVAINDMLVQAPNAKYIEFFPVWPRTQDASFTKLLTKGGFEVSSNLKAGVITNVSLTSRTDTTAVVKNPFASVTVVHVICAGASLNVAWTPDFAMFSFAAPMAKLCTITPN